jgi:hypothetical protein
MTTSIWTGTSNDGTSPTADKSTATNLAKDTELGPKTIDEPEIVGAIVGKETPVAPTSSFPVKEIEVASAHLGKIEKAAHVGADYNAKS